MEINEILCKDTGRTIKADKIYKIASKDTECIEEVISQCSLCPYSEKGREINQTCKNCYGTITQSRKIIDNKKSGRNNMIIENFRNTFEFEDDEYIKDMSADEFMKYVDVVANLGALGWNHGHKTDDKLRAYDKPNTWKSDCLECKSKNDKPKCVLAKEYLEDKYNTNIDFMSEKQLISDIPTEFICQNQAQTMYLV